MGLIGLIIFGTAFLFFIMGWVDGIYREKEFNFIKLSLREVDETNLRGIFKFFVKCFLRYGQVFYVLGGILLVICRSIVFKKKD